MDYLDEEPVPAPEPIVKYGLVIPAMYCIDGCCNFYLPTMFLAPKPLRHGIDDLNPYPCFAYLGNTNPDIIARLVYGQNVPIEMPNHSNISVATYSNSSLPKELKFFQMSNWGEMGQDKEFVRLKIQFWIDIIIRENPTVSKSDFAANLQSHFDFHGR